MPELFLIDAKWEGKIELIEKLKAYIKKQKPKSIAIFASIQFTNLNNFINEIEKLGIRINTTKAKRPNSEIQILGCDIYHDSFKDFIINDSDLILYIGDGLFHPKALLLAQSKEKNLKPIIIFDPITENVRTINRELIKKQLQKYKRNLKIFINSESIGIIVTIKSGQQYFLAAKKLKEHLEKQNKKVYIFIDDIIKLSDLENYTFIKAWVNTACPRIGTDDIVNTNQPIINLKEAFDPVKALEEME